MAIHTGRGVITGSQKVGPLPCATSEWVCVVAIVVVYYMMEF